MKKNICLLLLLALVLVTGGVTVSCTPSNKKESTLEHKTMYHCPMHPTYIKDKMGNCPICGMNLVPMNTNESSAGDSFVSTSETGVRINPAMIQSIGVQTERAQFRSLTREIRTSATIMPDERRSAVITTKVMGYVEKLYVNYTGQKVSKGQPLYSVYSPELISAQDEYLQTLRSQLPGDSGRLLESARTRLRNFDLSEEQILLLEKRGAPDKIIDILSPASGIIMEKMILEGQSIEPGMQLYKVVDYSRVWVEGALYQQDVPLVLVGQQGTIELDYAPGKQFTGTVTYIAPELNMESRTLMVRLELANTPDRALKPGMNATMTIHATINKNALTVPEQSVIHSGMRTIVVLAKGNGYFEPREIKIGQSAMGYTEVLEGIVENDDIVVSSQFLIDSESNLKVAVMQLGGTSTLASDEKDSVVEKREAHQPASAPTVGHSEYICTMCPEVHSDKPGSCPTCGMKLVLKK